MKVADRQTINVSTDLNIAGGNSINVPIVLRFFPDEVVLRSISYANANADTASNACQVWTNLVDDGVIASFVSNITFTSDIHSIFKITKRIQAGQYNFQVQFAPSNGANSLFTGSGGLVTFGVIKGQLSLILEFIRHG